MVDREERDRKKEKEIMDEKKRRIKNKSILYLANVRRVLYHNLVCSLAVLCALVLGSGMVSCAQGKGTLSLQLPKDAAGAELMLYTVALLEDDGSYTYCDGFADSGITVTDLNDTAAAEEAAQKLAVYAAENKISGSVQQVDADGILNYENLAEGLYLTVQSTGSEKILIQPSLVAVPSMTEGVPVYHVTITSKHSYPGGAVIATKVNEDGNALGGAQFVLQAKVYTGEVPDGAEHGADEKGSYYWKEYATALVSGQNGQIVLKDLPLGSYRFVETQAPNGYRMAEEPFNFEITAAGTVQAGETKYEAASGTVIELTMVNYRNPEEETDTETFGGSLGSSGSSSGGKSGGSGGNVKTGDDTLLWPYILMMTGAVIVIAVRAVSKKKRK